MTQPSPADELRAAEKRAHAGDWRFGLGLHAPIAALLGTAADMVTAYPQMGDAHDRQICDDFACDLVGAALAVARAITGSQP
ncbi:hypothetical protein ACFXHD_09820 [Streptomyces hydrogenans]|uniref:hypothetical protein n=1 Tax=Streptomyces hydrogenans TaxID=1873719 RepID=UPI0036C00183